MKKYEVTDIAHPQYPWLHRIRALRDFADIQAGTLGGYVQDEDNLSQDGTCWIYDDAIAMERAVVSGDAKVRNSAKVAGHSVVSSCGEVTDCARVLDNAIILAGRVADFSCICGDGILRENSSTRIGPFVTSDACVQGTVSGNVWILGKTHVLPGIVMENTLPDRICVNDKVIQVERDRGSTPSQHKLATPHPKKGGDAR